MDIQPPRFQIPVTQATSNRTLQQLQIGQQLVAKVIEQLPTKNDVLLQIGTQVARASSELPLLNQQQLKLEVVQLKDQIVLRVLEPAVKLQDVATSTLRRLLPLQQPIQNLNQSLGNTEQVLDNQPRQHNRLLQQISQLNQRLITQIPSSSQLSHPIGLKSALLSSGVFLEASLAKGNLNTVIPTVQHSHPDASQATSATVQNRLASRGETVRPTVIPPLTSQTAASATRSPQAQAAKTVTPSSVSTPAPTTNPAAANPIAPETSGPLQLSTAPLSRIDTKANLLRLITLLKSWPGVRQGVADGLPKAESPMPAQAHNQAATPRSAASSSNPQLVIEQLKSLLVQSESAVARITINQLSSSNTDDGNRMQWQTEIPALHGGQGQSVLMKIERDQPGKSRAPEAPCWRVTLELDPPNLGRIRCQLSLVNDQVHTEFWAEQPQTMCLIREHIPSFRERLQNAKLDPQKIVCSPVLGDHLQTEFAASPVLNEKA